MFRKIRGFFLVKVHKWIGSSKRDNGQPKFVHNWLLICPVSMCG